ncbi:MAG: ABC transporter permease [Herbaspirillum sp.]
MSTAEEVTSATTPRPRFGIFKRQLHQILALAALILIYGVFAILSSDFVTYSNAISILFSTVVVGILAIGTTFVIATAGIDLSLGTGMTLCAVMAGVFIVQWHIPLVIGLVLALAFGGLVGFVNALNIVYLRIPPFIATLAMMLAAEGLSLVVSHSAPIYFTDVAGYTAISTGQIFSFLPIPNAVLIFAFVAVIAHIVLTKTVFGRYALAIGSSEQAASRTGINVRRWLIMVYVVAGLFIGLAAIMITARLGSAQPALGLGYELQAIAAVVIGGTSLFGGIATIPGTVIGALIMSTLTNGLQIIAVQQEWQQVALGVVVVASVYVDSMRRKAS